MTIRTFGRYAAYLVLAAMLTFAATLPTSAANKNRNTNTAAAQATPAPTVEAAPVATPAAVQTATPAPVRAAQTPQRKTSPVGIIILVLIAAAIALYFAFRKGNDDNNSGATGAVKPTREPYSTYGSTTPRNTAVPSAYSPPTSTLSTTPDAPAAVEAQADGDGTDLSNGTVVPAS